MLWAYSSCQVCISQNAARTEFFSDYNEVSWFEFIFWFEVHKETVGGWLTNQVWKYKDGKVPKSDRDSTVTLVSINMLHSSLFLLN